MGASFHCLSGGGGGQENESDGAEWVILIKKYTLNLRLNRKISGKRFFCNVNWKVFWTSWTTSRCEHTVFVSGVADIYHKLLMINHRLIKIKRLKNRNKTIFGKNWFQEQAIYHEKCISWDYFCQIVSLLGTLGKRHTYRLMRLSESCSSTYDFRL